MKPAQVGPGIGSPASRVRELGKVLRHLREMMERIPKEWTPAEEISAFLTEMESHQGEVERILGSKLGAVRDMAEDLVVPRLRRPSDDP